MRVLAISTWYPFPPNNGSKTRAYYLLHALQDISEVTLLAFHPETDALASHTPHDEGGLHVYPVNDDPFRFVKVSALRVFASPMPVAYWRSSSMSEAVKHVFRASRWDAVVAFQPSAAAYALLCDKVPCLLDVDTALSYQMHDRFVRESRTLRRARTWISWQKAHRYEQRVFKRYQICTLVSKLEVDYLRRMLKDEQARIEVISNGVDCERNQPGLAAPRLNTLVYSGALWYQANYDAMQYFLAEIYPRIKQAVSDVSLTITGSTESVDLNGLQLDESVKLPGYVDDIRPIVAGSAICVAPIRHGTGTRLKILEAMALGTPVVSTSKGAEGLDLIDGQHAQLADDPEAFAAVVVELLREEERRQWLAVNARRLVETKYSWSQIGHRFCELVEDVITQP